MGIFDFLKKKKGPAVSLSLNDNKVNEQKTKVEVQAKPTDSRVQSSQPVLPKKTPVVAYADSSTIDADERPFYKEDSYYTLSSYPNTMMERRVITFQERKTISYPSREGLYVAEILLLDYCRQGKYPKPKEGYPGFWWFEYGIRDVGHALKSLEQRGFIQFCSGRKQLASKKVDELKSILASAGQPVSGKKDDLIDRIMECIPESEWKITTDSPKYELTEVGTAALDHNGYVPYMHRHNRKTTEDDRFGSQFNVWSMNKLFQDGSADNWQIVVAKQERLLFGTAMATEEPHKETKPAATSKEDKFQQRDKMREYIKSKRDVIANGVKTKSDGLAEENKGIDLKKIGKDKEAIVQFYIAIGKKFDAPALYNQMAILLNKYMLYEEELQVLNVGLQVVDSRNPHYKEIAERKRKVQSIMSKK